MPLLFLNVVSLCKNVCMTIEREIGSIPEITRGDRMRVSLRHGGVSVQAMADYLDVSRASVSNWINGRVAPSKQTMRLWAFRCGVPLTWLETGRAPDHDGPGLSYTTRDSNPEPADIHERRRPLDLVALLSKAS